MFAVIETGGKQYRVEKGDVIDIELTPVSRPEAAPAKGKTKTKAKAQETKDTVKFERVLMVGKGDEITMGAPLVSGASVSAVVERQLRAPKVLIFKKKRRKQYRRTQGHRQNLLRVRVEEISL